MVIEVRNVRTADEFHAWCDTMDIGFYNPTQRGQGAHRLRNYPNLDLTWGGFEGDRVVSTLRGLDMRLTVPGPTEVPMDGITGVAVLPTHRRLGLAQRMMAAELRRAKESGYPLAGLVAAEYPIYGRFGFGPACEAAQWTVDARDLRFIRELPGRVELVSADVARVEAAQLWERIRPRLLGAISRESWRWDKDTGVDQPGDAGAPLNTLYALVRDDAGQVVGYTHYSNGPEDWVNQRPEMSFHVGMLLATDPVYEARIWQYLAGHDWVTRVVGPEFDRDDTLWRDLLVNRRMAVSGQEWDFTWLRVLDTPAALGARSYSAPGRVVLRIEDKDGYAQGTFALEAGEDGWAECSATLEPADVTLPVARLAEIYLGGHTAARLAALGLIEEHSAGAVRRLSRMFATDTAPYNPMIF